MLSATGQHNNKSSPAQICWGVMRLSVCKALLQPKGVPMQVNKIDSSSKIEKAYQIESQRKDDLLDLFMAVQKIEEVKAKKEKIKYDRVIYDLATVKKIEGAQCQLRTTKGKLLNSVL